MILYHEPKILPFRSMADPSGHHRQKKSEIRSQQNTEGGEGLYLIARWGGTVNLSACRMVLCAYHVLRVSQHWIVKQLGCFNLHSCWLSGLVIGRLIWQFWHPVPAARRGTAKEKFCVLIVRRTCKVAGSSDGEQREWLLQLLIGTRCVIDGSLGESAGRFCRRDALPDDKNNSHKHGSGERFHDVCLLRKMADLIRAVKNRLEIFVGTAARRHMTGLCLFSRGLSF